MLGWFWLSCNTQCTTTCLHYLVRYKKVFPIFQYHCTEAHVYQAVWDTIVSLDRDILAFLGTP